MTGPLYLDHNATAPPAPGVPETLARALSETWGNPSSIHARGRAARAALEAARAAIAASLGAREEEVVFTSGGSEADALAIRGPIEAGAAGAVLASAVEHPAVLETARAAAERGGVPFRILEVDGAGRVAPETLAAALAGCERPLVSIMFAQNETGVLNDVARLGSLVRKAGGLFHTDAVQAYGKLPIDFGRLPCDLMSVSAHKIGGPPGAGALLVRAGVPLAPYCAGGGQERGRRQGTEALPALVAFGVAARLVRGERLPRMAELASLRDRLERAVERELGPRVRIAGRGAPRLPNTSALLVRGIAGGDLAAACERRGLAISAGSACHAAGHGASPLGAALGLDPEWSRGLVRLSLGPGLDAAAVDRAAGIVVEAVRELLG